MRPEQTPEVPDRHDPHLAMPLVRRPRAIALLLHGGEPRSTLPVGRLDPAYLRMLPFARDVEVRSRGRIGAVLLRHAVRGWNGDVASPVVDAQWALGRIRRRWPDVPVAAVGHSMGGRTALELARRGEVDACVALAPWLSDAFAAELLVGTPLLLRHGRQDTLTDYDATEDLARRVREAGGDVEWQSVPGWHTMLWRPSRWHAETSRFLMRRLLPS